LLADRRQPLLLLLLLLLSLLLESLLVGTVPGHRLLALPARQPQLQLQREVLHGRWSLHVPPAHCAGLLPGAKLQAWQQWSEVWRLLPRLLHPLLVLLLVLGAYPMPRLLLLRQYLQV
jgi:hypothetical protein